MILGIYGGWYQLIPTVWFPKEIIWAIICIKKPLFSAGFVVIFSSVPLLYLARLLSYEMNERWQKAKIEEEHWEF